MPSIKHRLIIAAISMLPLLGSAAMAAEPPAAPADQPPSCGDCHDQAKTFDTNVHAFGAGKKGALTNDVCTTCHGDGADHIANGGDKTKITVPRGLTGANDTCLMCHQKTTDTMSRRGGMHSNSAAVNCLSCHSIHNAKSDHLVATAQMELCGSCHTQAASLRNKPYGHKLDRGVMQCSTCHEPHGRPGKDSVRTTASGELACVGCHTDKRGPYVYRHGAVAAGDCSTCHEMHGSMNPKQLTRANVQQVCLECHSTIGSATFGSQPPSFHNVSTARYQNCTTCHAAIHGSNRDPQLLK
jgi:DmsE family decaheme c-type cytochrome